MIYRSAPFLVTVTPDSDFKMTTIFDAAVSVTAQDRHIFIPTIDNK